MIKNIFFDMDGTLIDCEIDKFIPPYKTALVKKFAYHPNCAGIVRDIIMESVKAMLANDGSHTNREAFIEYIRTCDSLGVTAEELENAMTDFYNEQYLDLQSVINPKPIMAEAVKMLQDKGYRLVVTTNPLFPLVALLRRLEWGGHKPEYFEFVTSYETSRYCKPDVRYYKQVIESLDVKPEETLIVGNDRREDVHAGKEAGLRAYYLTDTPIDNGTGTLPPDYKGNSNDFLEFVRSLPKVLK